MTEDFTVYMFTRLLCVTVFDETLLYTVFQKCVVLTFCSNVTSCQLILKIIPLSETEMNYL